MVRDRHAVTSAQAGETVSFHRARKPFTDASTDNINMLARHKMLDRQLCADIQNRIFANTEFDQLTPRPLSPWRNGRIGLVVFFTFAHQH